VLVFCSPDQSQSVRQSRLSCLRVFPVRFLALFQCELAVRLLVRRMSRVGEAFFRVVYFQHVSSSLLCARLLGGTFVGQLSQTIKIRRDAQVPDDHFSSTSKPTLLSPSSSAVRRRSLCRDRVQPRTEPSYQPSSPSAMHFRHLRRPGSSTIRRGGRPRRMRSAA
jgi:hypothetical protein